MFTAGIFGLVWAGLAIHARWGKTGAWIYVGALCITAAIGNLTNPAPATTPPAPPTVTVVTVVTAPEPPAPATP